MDRELLSVPEHAGVFVEDSPEINPQLIDFTLLS